MNQETAHQTRLFALQRLPLRRWAALFAILLGLLAQTLHTHAATDDSFAGKSGHALLGSQSSDLCPLCLAAHTACPVPAVATMVLPACPAAVSLDANETFHAAQPAFAHFSRPPPTSLL